MSTGVIVLIVAIVVIAIAVVVALLVGRSKRRAQRSTSMGLPELGALSTTGLDKEHASGPAEHPSSPPGKA